MAEQYKWSGAKWWKFDFHTHTPASDDYGKGSTQAILKTRTHKEWLLDYMRAGIDCVVVTDHNTGVWIDDLTKSLMDLETEKHHDFRKLYLFPGVEISTSEGIHIVAILPIGKRTSDIDSLLGAVGFPSDKKGTCEACATKSAVEIIDAIVKTGGIVIPAHVDDNNGLFTKLSGNSLKGILDSKNLLAVELLNTSFQKPAIYIEQNLTFSEVLGSDAHHPEKGNTERSKYPGSYFSWVKMGEPNLEGLRLALLDGPVSIKRSDVCSTNPNEHRGEFIIEEFQIGETKYIGRSENFICGFNPWLNTIIGGRGTGKSTIIELLRKALHRVHELDSFGKTFNAEFTKYNEIYENRADERLLTEDTILTVIYRRDGKRYRINWSSKGNTPPIEVENTEGNWQISSGEIMERFPIRIFSQKQIYEMARTPQALLKLVNEAPDVEFVKLSGDIDKLQNKYLSLKVQIREIESDLQNENKMKGDLEDITNRISFFEKSGHSEILKLYQMRQRQLRMVENWENSWFNSAEEIKKLKLTLQPNDIDESIFVVNNEIDIDLLNKIKAKQAELAQINEKLDSVAVKYQTAKSDWESLKENSSWRSALLDSIAQYETLHEKLMDVGISNLQEYGQLVQQKQSIEEKIKNLISKKEFLLQLNSQGDLLLKEIAGKRTTLSKNREEFLKKQLSNNDYVDIRLVPYGDVENTEDIKLEFRGLINRTQGGLDEDIEKIVQYLKADYYSETKNGLIDDKKIIEFETHLTTIKNDIESIYSGSDIDKFGNWFIKHIRGLSPDMIDKLKYWYPKDSLSVLYSVGDQGKKVPVKLGSAGQKTAALLAFLLTYGTAPLILDQPEDDLDNHLIYELIVAQLKTIKSTRQVIVVTHNANIVVNGDSENVIALGVSEGRTNIVAKGCLQEASIRDEICNVMEGGTKAFDLRYKRIREGGINVR
jgi:energy-coupling factor transporter ATP-binding protein EcfA2